jgi:hypothetical protein
MASMTDDGAAGYGMAERLKLHHPNHELLRLLTPSSGVEGARHDRERVERFWDAEKYGHPDVAPQAKLDAISFALLAKAMDDAVKGPPMPNISVRRVRVNLDPEVDIFSVILTREGKGSGSWPHTASSKSELTAFLTGAKAMAATMGTFITLPEISRTPAAVCTLVPDDGTGTGAFSGGDIDDEVPF